MKKGGSKGEILHSSVICVIVIIIIIIFFIIIIISYGNSDNDKSLFQLNKSLPVDHSISLYDFLVLVKKWQGGRIR